jgi:hypothetical protein
MEGSLTEVPKEHHQHKRSQSPQPCNKEELAIYSNSLQAWFNMEQALDTLTEATITIGMKTKLGSQTVNFISRRMEFHYAGKLSSSGIPGGSAF